MPLPYIKSLNLQGVNFTNDDTRPADSDFYAERVKPISDEYQLASCLSTNLFICVMNGLVVMPREKNNTDDLITQGYSYQGLPFMIIVDGYYGTDNVQRLKLFEFIDQQIVPRVNEYIREVMNSPAKHQETLQSIIDDIFDLRNIYAYGIQFTLTLAMTYQQGDQLYATGFGVGNCGLLLKNQAQQIKQIINSQTYQGAKDGFDEYCAGKIRRQVIERSGIFHQAIERGDELIGYTYLPPSMEIAIPVAEEKPNVERWGIDPQKFQEVMEQRNKQAVDGKLLLVRFWSKIKSEIYEAIENAQKKGSPINRGDDISLGLIQIPNLPIQERIQKDLSQLVILNKHDYLANKMGSCSFFRNKNRLSQSELIEEFTRHNTSAMVRTGALLLVLLDIQHSQFAFTARNSVLRKLIIRKLIDQGIELREDSDRLVVPVNLPAAKQAHLAFLDYYNQHSNSLLRNYLNNQQTHQVSWFESAINAMDVYYEKPLNDQQPLLHRFR